MKKVEMKCIGLDIYTGGGIVKYQGKNIVVPYFLPKEVGVVEIDEDRKFNKYKLVKLYKADKDRVDENCPVYSKCGGCHLLHMNYPVQMEYKKSYVSFCLKNEKLDNKIDEEIWADSKTGYRNKMQVAYKQKDGEIIYGFYEEESHRIIPLKSCLVQSKNQNDICRAVMEIMKQMKIMPYNEDKRTGIIRFVVVREAKTTKEILVTIVTNGDVFPGRNDFIKRVRAKCPYITSIVQNINTRKTSIILGDEEKVLFGPGFINEKLCGINGW